MPVDDSTHAREVLVFALDKHADAEITGVHIISPIAVIGVFNSAAWDDRMLERERKQPTIDDALTDLVIQLNVTRSHVVKWGSTSSTVGRVAAGKCVHRDGFEGPISSSHELPQRR
ncbi:hypothetical protein [Halalkalicoccus paucihalophilus]|uniref:hypothetical protein n=1 Tax=Halalkalicoccus paucihalophilus TaxID=1008153 RepID=UPI0034A47230